MEISLQPSGELLASEVGGFPHHGIAAPGSSEGRVVSGLFSDTKTPVEGSGRNLDVAESFSVVRQHADKDAAAAFWLAEPNRVAGVQTIRHELGDGNVWEHLALVKLTANGLTGLCTRHSYQLLGGVPVLVSGREFYQFDGASAYISFPGPSFALDEVTISFELPQPVTSASAPEALLYMDDGSVRWALYLGSASGSAINETLMVADDRSSGRTYIRDTLAAGWHDLTLSWDGSRYQFYLDGAVPTTYGNGSNHAPQGSLVSGRVGRGFSSRYFSGNVDKVALSSSTGIEVSYDAAEGAGHGAALDTSGNGRDGTLVNVAYGSE